MDIFSIGLNMKEHGDSNEYKQHTVFKASVFFLDFETAVVSEPSVFEPLKFHCIDRDMQNVPQSRIIGFQWRKEEEYTNNNVCDASETK